MPASSPPGPAGPRPGGRSRRDRHGRGLRGSLVPPHLPAHRTPAQRFDDLVMDAVERLSQRWPEAMEAVDVAVEEIPDVTRDPLLEAVPLGRAEAAGPGRRARIVVHRRPVLDRMGGPGAGRAQARDEDLPRMVHMVVVEQLAALLGRSPEEIDPDLGWETD